MPRRKLVAGNWKMNTTRAEAVALAQAVAAGAGASPACDVAVFPPFVWLDAVATAI
jgi:triosephosphate isomerase